MLKSSTILFIICLLFITACDDEPEKIPAAAIQDSVRQTALGEVIGIHDKADTFAWLGMPYAQAPKGDLRWRAPRPINPWQNTYQALTFNTICPQIGGIGADVDKSQYGLIVGDEDCLYLNVWAPKSLSQSAIDTGEKLPVMVWIHGGGNSIGTANTYPYASNLAGTQKVVVVTINYRLGFLGWFSHPALKATAGESKLQREDQSGNFGTLDIIESLRWVQKNITAFGGDPDNVTIFGESAGGFNVYSMMLSPLAEGLFHKGISQSGSVRGDSVSAAENYRDDSIQGHDFSSAEIAVLQVLAAGKATTREEAKQWLAKQSSVDLSRWLRSLPSEQLFVDLQGDKSKMGLLTLPQLLQDGYVLPAMSPKDIMQNPAVLRNIPLITGTNRDEAKTFMVGDRNFTKLLFGKIPRIKDKDQYHTTAKYMSQQWRFFGADLPAQRLTSLPDRKPVYVYRFDFDDLKHNFLISMRELFGAGHGLEISYPFGLAETPDSFFNVNKGDTFAQRQQLANTMSGYWANFAYTGSPNRGRNKQLPHWQAWDNTEGAAKTLLLDTEIDGGIRSINEVVTVVTMKQSLLAEPSLQNKQQRLCRTWADVFYRSLLGSLLFDEQEFSSLGDGGCDLALLE